MAARHLLCAICAAAILWSPSSPALSAETPAPTPSPSAPPQIVRVVTADRSNETLHNATRTTYVVTRDEIDRHGYRTIGDALATLPGVEITRYGPIGQNVSYGIRGSSSAQVLVLVNGLPAAGEFANSVQLGTATTAGVRRIEVVEGGGSTLYGTGAIGGIINVITESQYVPLNVKTAYGTFGDRELQVSAAGLTFERIVAANAFALPESAGNPSTRGNGDDESSTVRYGVDRKIGAIEASLRAGAESDRLGAAGFFPYLSPTSREDDVNENASATFTLDRARASTTLQLGGSRQQLAFYCEASDPNCFFSVPSLSTESRLDFSLRNALETLRDRLIYGIDLSRGNVREDSGAGAPDAIATASLSQSAAYVQETRPFANGSAYVGLRGERDGSLGGEFSPSAGASVDFSPAFEIKANAATAFRAPNASELYFPGYGNPALRAERARVADVTLIDRRALGGITVGWFANTTNDLIVAQITGTDASGNPIYHPENVDHASIRGLTFDVRTQPVHGIATSLTITDLYRALDVDTGARLPNDPVLTANLQLTLHAPATSAVEDAGVTFRTVGARAPLGSFEPYFAQAGSYTIVDAFARFRVARRALLAIRGYNLGNERYAEVAGYPMPGRTLAIELTTK